MINRARDFVGTLVLWAGCMLMSRRLRERWLRVMKTGDPEERVAVFE